MHIPDGYLSLSTCAVTYAVAVPFWTVALRRVQRLLNTRLVPLLAVFSAFSFVIMMFNLPLPGGTTGHAVGVGIAAVVLGPWAAMLAISIALLIQAVFFGDGGITALGANCFNMAIVGSLAAYSVYRLIAGRTAIDSSRRVIAAAVAGYVAINIAALLTAIEFGIQPALFHDAAGTPLYAPYPLHIAIPAMMIGHLGFAGLAEAIISGGLVAYLQRTEPTLLRLTAPTAPETDEAAVQAVASKGGWLSTRMLWGTVAVLMILTPLGLLAAGVAWGEWSTEDFADPEMRQQIVAASGNQPLPEQTPAGLERLASLWTAPLPGYAPAFIRNPAVGYILSAMMGIGLIILLFLGIGWLTDKRRGPTATTAG